MGGKCENTFHTYTRVQTHTHTCAHKTQNPKWEISIERAIKNPRSNQLMKILKTTFPTTYF